MDIVVGLEEILGRKDWNAAKIGGPLIRNLIRNRLMDKTETGVTKRDDLKHNLTKLKEELDRTAVGGPFTVFMSKLFAVLAKVEGGASL